MKKLISLSFALLGLAAATSCIEDDLDPCPPEGGAVEVTLRVEKFQTRPPYAPSDLEEQFSRRIHSLDYLLYAEDRLIERGCLDDVEDHPGESYLFRLDSLPFGSYRLAFAANTESRMMTGQPDAPELYYIVYRQEPNVDDHFRAVLPFEVTCPCRNEFETVLRRVHGVTRFRFENLPEEIASVEVLLDNVGERMPLGGDPDRSVTVSKRVSMTESTMRREGSFVLGTFPTLPGRRTSWRLRLYEEASAVPLYDRVVTDTLRIECNQLIELTARFHESDFQGDIDFSVDVDTAWDGTNEGGEVEGDALSESPVRDL